MKKHVTTAFAFIVLLTANAFAQVPSYVPTNGLVGWWPFNGNANDESVNGNNATVSGATLTTDRFGNAGKAYSFNGTNNFINVTNSSIAAFNQSSFSASVWFKTNMTTVGNFIRYDNCVNNSGWGIRIGSLTQGIVNGLEFPTNRASTNNTNSTATYNNNLWHLAVYSRDVTTMKDLLYIDGILVSQKSFTSINALSNTGSVFRFGSCAGYEYFSGLLDDIALWNRALTQQEITTLFNAPAPCSTPTATITPQGSTTFCQGGSVNLNASTGTNYTYEWYRNGQLITGATTSVYQATNSGSYTVKVIDGTCNATSTATTVTVNPLPTASISYTGSPWCSSATAKTVTQTGTTGGTYTSSPAGINLNATNGTITPSTSLVGTYTITYTIPASGGCSAFTTTTSVTFNATPAAIISANGATTFCQGNSVDLNTNNGNGLTYQWKNNNVNINGATAASYTSNTSGSYSVVVTNSNNCTATSSPIVVTVNPLPNVTLSGLNNITNYHATPQTLIGNPAGGTYMGPGVTNNLFNPTTAGLGMKNVSYDYTNASGCSGKATLSTMVYDTLGVVCTTYDTITTNVYDTTYITINDTVYTTVTDTLIINTTLSLPSPNNENTILIYPNPASDHITIDNGNYTAMAGYSIKIKNNAGQDVFQSAINQAQFYVDLSTWTGKGLYFVHLYDSQNNTVTVRKIVLQ